MAAFDITVRDTLKLLDPENERVQLDTLMKAAAAVGKRVRVELENLPG